MSDTFKSWRMALAEHKLEPEQFAVLQRMVTDGEAETLEAAAAMLGKANNKASVRRSAGFRPG